MAPSRELADGANAQFAQAKIIAPTRASRGRWSPLDASSNSSRARSAHATAQTISAPVVLAAGQWAALLDHDANVDASWATPSPADLCLPSGSTSTAEMHA
jgi:hypothetical protein